MPVDRDLMRQIRDLDEFDLRRLLIFVRGVLVAREGGDPRREVETVRKVTYRQEHVRCGRDNCTRCPHGPYWYAYWRGGGRPPSPRLCQGSPPGGGAAPGGGEV